MTRAMMGRELGGAPASWASGGFGFQGGDPRRMVDGVRIDLSTCVNFYGPPARALAVLSGLNGEDLQIHPYAASAQLKERYAVCLGVDPRTLVAGRGTTEFIWALGREVPHDAVAVPLPAYTDYLKVFPGRGFARYVGEQVPSVEQIEAALVSSRLVIVANPHNPTGIALDPVGLVEAAARHPAATLVVDESYVDFLPDPDRATVIGCSTDNVVVLRSPSKFYGIAATRAGVAWCQDRNRLRQLLGTRETWPMSALDVAVATAALSRTKWARRIRVKLAEDAAWLADTLRRLPATLIEDGVDVHFRCLFTPHPQALAAQFAHHGVGVRVLGQAHGVSPGAVRILAPLPGQRPAVAAAVHHILDGQAADALAG